MNTFLAMIASNAIVATLLALSVAFLGRIWKNPAALHVLWLVVLLKLFTPPFITTNLPFVGGWLTPAASTAALSGVEATTTKEASGSSAATGTTTSGDLSSANSSRTTLGKKAGEIIDRKSWSLAGLIAAVWIGGAAVMALRYSLLIRQFTSLIRLFEPAPPAILSLVEETACKLGVKRVPQVLMTSDWLPPLVWSAGIAPRLILPSRLFARLNPTAQATIIAHELVHVSRRDHLVRLLELAAATVFWWHPVVWWATWKLRELEEQCCDSRVLELAPENSRTYATTLVETLDFLAERPRLFVPLPTAVYSSGSLSRRIRMLTSTSANRLNSRTAIVVAALAAFPLVVALGIEQEKAGAEKAKAGTEQEQKPAAEAAVLRGRVQDKSGQALAGARVRVASPATDMRFVNPGSGPQQWEAVTDDNGEYRLEITGKAMPASVSVDAMKPGYRKLSGTLMSGGESPRPELRAGTTTDLDLKLEPALYFKGVVVDENDKPIAGVQIGGNANSDRSSGGVERTISNEPGEFELFNYAAEPFVLRDVKTKGVVSFFHPKYVGHTIADVYSLGEKERTTMRIVLPTGHNLSGVVRDTSGNPVPRLMVKAISGGKTFARKAVLTDADGRFALQGLPPGRAELTARAVDIQQKIQLSLELNSDKNDLDVRLQAMNVPADLKTVTVLGMKLTDATPQLRAAYNVHNAGGALILDPGPDSERLHIGKLEHGFNFWMVGNKSVANVREFIEQILAEFAAQDRDRPPYQIRVVYSLSTLAFDGTNTQYFKLTNDDIEQLKAVSEQLKAEAN